MQWFCRVLTKKQGFLLQTFQKPCKKLSKYLFLCYHLCVNLYDFDKTIYKFDSATRFYFFVILRHPHLFWHLFKTAFWGVAFFLRAVSLSTLKEKVFSITKHVKNLNLELEKFWDKEQKNIFSWYLSQKRADDVVCSASPQFLVEKIFQKINPTATIVASQLEASTSNFKSNFANCKGNMKVEYLKQRGFNRFENGYSDSSSDKPMLSLCKNKFRVLKNGKIVKFED